MDLSSVDLLKRCLHRQTQKNEVNNNRVILKQCARNEIFGPTNFRNWISLCTDIFYSDGNTGIYESF